MVQQVKVVSILMIVHGSLLGLVALLYTVIGPVMFALVAQDKRGMAEDSKAVLTFFTIFSVAAGLVGLACALLNIVAGIRALKFRGRTLALVALISNIPGMAVV